MKQSLGRFLTTHTGSLPRPDDLIRTMFAKEEGVPVDREALAQRISAAVRDVVGRQSAAGVDIVNDGELSKPSYTTYIKDRLTGFDGTSQPLEYQDLVEFPALAKRVFGDPGRSRRQTPACTGPIEFAGAAEVAQDIQNLKAATLDGLAADEVLATPGEFTSQLGLQDLVSPLRLRGMAALLARIKRQIRDQRG